MSEDAKRSIQGALAMKPLSSDGRKPSSAADAATPPTGKRVIIKSADMLPEMQKEAVDTAISAFEKHSVEKDVAEHIKKEFDKKHGSTWHCIVGRNFAWIGWVGLFTRQAQPRPALIGSVVSIRFLCDS